MVSSGAMEYKNYTPHTIRVIGQQAPNFGGSEVDKDGYLPTLTFPSQGVARVAVEESPLSRTYGRVTLYRCETGEVTGLPTQEEGVLVIVSAMVRGASDRDDLVSPHGLVRDEEGVVVGCKGFGVGW